MFDQLTKFQLGVRGLTGDTFLENVDGTFSKVKFLDFEWNQTLFSDIHSKRDVKRNKLEYLITDQIKKDYLEEVSRFGNYADSFNIIRRNTYSVLLDKFNSYDAFSKLVSLNRFFLMEIYNSDEFLAVLEKWFNYFNQIRKCKICGKKYKTTMLPHPIFNRSNGCEICCFTCEIMEKPKKEDILERAKIFVDNCGFIPNSNYGPESLEFSIRVNPKDWKNILISYGKLGRPEYVKEQIGSWFKTLALAGCLPENVLITSRGIKCLSKDGHECNSLAEQFVCNWLHDKNIEHTKEPFYPFHKDLNNTNRMRADWKINNCLVEYFGLSGNLDYDTKTKNKMIIAMENNIELISIFPSDLNRLNQIFAKFIVDNN